MTAIILQFVAMNKLPNKIRATRLAKNVVLEDLAFQLGTSAAQISMLERGKRKLSLDWMTGIAAALGVSPSELLNDEDNALVLDDDEMRLLERYRYGSAEQRAALDRVSEALVPYRAPPREDNNQTKDAA